MNSVAPVEIDLHVLTVGSVRVRPDNVARTWRPMLWWTVLSRTWTSWLPVHVVLLRHPAGVVLFDTGQHPDSIADPDYYPRGLLGWVYRRQAQFRVESDEPLRAALAPLGLAPDEVATVVLSHLHQDHVGNLGEVADAHVLVDPSEVALLGARTPEQHGVLVARIATPTGGFTPAAYERLDEPALAPFTEGHDLFGDRSLVLLPTPGHSPGSMSLLVRRAGAAPVLLVGDLTYEPDLLDHEIVPGTGATRTQVETTGRVNQLKAALPGLVIVAAHDGRARSRLEESSR